LLVSLGRHFCVASAGKVASPVDVPQRGGGLTLCRGCGPKCWVHNHGLQVVCHVHLGLWAARSCGVVLVGERWYVGTMVLEGGVGCLLSMVMQIGGDSGSLTMLRASTLCCANDEVVLDVGRRRRVSATLGGLFFINVGPSHVCSSHNNHVLFSLGKGARS
jgi:hypothetical protein